MLCSILSGSCRAALSHNTATANPACFADTHSHKHTPPCHLCCSRLCTEQDLQRWGGHCRCGSGGCGAGQPCLGTPLAANIAAAALCAGALARKPNALVCQAAWSALAREPGALFLKRCRATHPAVPPIRLCHPSGCATHPAVPPPLLCSGQCVPGQPAGAAHHHSVAGVHGWGWLVPSTCCQDSQHLLRHEQPWSAGWPPAAAEAERRPPLRMMGCCCAAARHGLVLGRLLQTSRSAFTLFLPACMR